MTFERVSRMFIATAMTISLSAASLFAQSNWLGRNCDKSIALEILKPNIDDADFPRSALFLFLNRPSRSPFDRGGSPKFATSAVFLSLRYQIKKKAALLAELPFAYGAFDDLRDSESAGTIGNPYVGIEIQKRDSSIFAEFGIRAPITSEENIATFIGLLSDIDRFEAFFPNYLPISGKISYRHKLASGLTFRISGGMTFSINTDKDQSEEAAEVYIGYSTQLGYESDLISLGGGFTGRALLTEQDFNYDERSIHQLGFATSVGLRSLRPGAYIRLAFDNDLEDVLDFVLGLNLSIQLK